MATLQRVQAPGLAPRREDGRSTAIPRIGIVMPTNGVSAEHHEAYGLAQEDPEDEDVAGQVSPEPGSRIPLTRCSTSPRACCALSAMGS
jgi:hypothetical protein